MHAPWGIIKIHFLTQIPYTPVCYYVVLPLSRNNCLLIAFISIDGCDFEAFDCFYSPAKRRGPNPGRLNPLLGGTAMTGTGTTTGKSGGGGRIAKNNDSSAAQGGKHSLATPSTTTPTSQPPLRNHDGSEWQPNTMLGVGGAGATTAALMGTAGSVVGGSSINSYAVDHQQQQTNIQHQLNLLQQQIQQQQQQQQQLQATKQIQHQHQQPQFQNIMNPSEMAASAVSAAPPPVEPNAQRRKVTEKPLQQQSGIPRSIMAHTHLLDRGDPDGSRLRAYYKLSIDEMFRLPCTPTDEEYCARTGQQMPGSHLAALSAARFAEAALGAIVHNEVGLAMELCNAVVHCLRESVQEPVDDSVMFEVAKAYFLLGVFRAYRGDMTRYFKYRRVCLTYLSKLEVRG